MNLSVYEYEYSIFASAGENNRVFGYSNDELKKEIGVKYPWGNYKQVPVRDFLYAGMENTSATTFSSRYVVDAVGFNDRKYTNVNAHELAHQWFGDLVTAESSKHHWLQEGFATYYALFGDVFGWGCVVAWVILLVISNGRFSKTAGNN